MRISTSTNIMEDVEKVFDVISLEECITRCAKAGFKYIDINLNGQSRPGMPLTKDNWKEWANYIKDFSKKIGVEFKQSHSHFYNPGNPEMPDSDWREEMVRRSIIVSGILGVNWVVMHPATVNDGVWYSYEKSLEFNLNYFLSHAELAKKQNTGIAIENLVDPKYNRRFGGHPNNLITLIDTINEPNVGICWDFGHANRSGVDQVEALKRIGKRLKATHIDDNHGGADEHLPPFYGDVDWRAVMRVLKDIDYRGDFSFEIQNFFNILPDGEFRDDLLKFTYRLGEYMLSLE